MREGVDGLDGRDPDPTDALKTEEEVDQVSPEVDGVEDDLDDLDAPVPESSSGGYMNWWVCGCRPAGEPGPSKPKSREGRS